MFVETMYYLLVAGGIAVRQEQDPEMHGAWRRVRLRRTHSCVSTLNSPLTSSSFFGDDYASSLRKSDLVIECL